MAKSGQAAFVAALVLSSQPVWADVTPEEVWQNWQDTATAQGQKVTAESTARDGTTLTVTGITLEMTGEGGESSALIDEMRFMDNGDGTVAILMPDSFPVLLKIPAMAGVEGAGPRELALTITMPDADITASGVPLALSYQTDLPSIEITAVVSDGSGDSATTADVVLRLTEVSGNYLIEAAESGQNLTEDFAAGTLDLSIKGSGGDPEGEISVTLSLTDIGGQADLTGIPASGMADLPTALLAGMTLDMTASYGIGSFDVAGKDAGAPLKMTGALGGGTFEMSFAARHFKYAAAGKSTSLNFSGTDPAQGPITFSATLASTSSALEMSGADWADIADFNAALKAGLKMSGAFGLGPSSFDFVGGADDAKTSVNASVGSFDTSFAMDAAQLQYGVGSKALKVTMSSPEIPMPEASLSLTELALDFAMPLAKSDRPAPFNLLTKVIDLNVAEALWGMIDPGGALPHDPASLIVDARGTATLTSDLIEDGMAMAAGAGSPPLLNSLDLTQFLLKVAGAEVTALGGFTFDNTDMTTIPGMPLPTGKVDIRAVGLNGLTDKLVAMGLLPEDQAMQGRMMLSMFANTSADKDEITSTLEFKDKHFFANGQQLQ